MLDFHDLYESYAPDVYRFAYWLAGNVQEAEDITAETFIRVWVNYPSVRTETLKAYLFTIARNIYLGQWRKRKRQVALEDSQPDPQPGPDKRAEDHAELESVRQILQAIPEMDRAAFVLRVQHDLPYAEIARILQLSTVCVKVKVHRVRKRLLAQRMRQEF